MTTQLRAYARVEHAPLAGFPKFFEVRFGLYFQNIFLVADFRSLESQFLPGVATFFPRKATFWETSFLSILVFLLG